MAESSKKPGFITPKLDGNPSTCFLKLASKFSVILKEKSKRALHFKRNVTTWAKQSSHQIEVHILLVKIYLERKTTY